MYSKSNITDRAQNSFKQLATAAQALSSASDDLSKVIRHLDASLKKLNLGITAWIEVGGRSDDTQYWREELGYAEIDGKWGVALREITGWHLDQDESTETWMYNEAPRDLRSGAIGKLPDLLERMLQLTEETTRELKSKIDEASEFTFVVSALVPKPTPPAPQHWQRPEARVAASSPFGKRETELEPKTSEKAAPMQFRETTGTVPGPISSPISRSLPAERPNGVRPLPAERIS